MYTAMLLWIAKYDDVDMNQLDAAGLAAYQADKTNYDDIFFKPKLNPTASWAVPLVTGHKYRMYWDIGQLNWSKMKIEVANPWKSTDLNILFNYPYTENYEVIEFFGKYDTSFATSGADPLIYLPPQSLADNQEADWKAGYSKFDMTKKELDFVINAATGSSKTLEA